MKKIAVILACMLACLTLFTGCTKQKDGDDQDTNFGNSVEIDDTDIGGDAEAKPDTENNPDNVEVVCLNGDFSIRGVEQLLLAKQTMM